MQCVRSKSETGLSNMQNLKDEMIKVSVGLEHLFIFTKNKAMVLHCIQCGMKKVKKKLDVSYTNRTV